MSANMRRTANGDVDVLHAIGGAAQNPPRPRWRSDLCAVYRDELNLLPLPRWSRPPPSPDLPGAGVQGR